MFVVWAILGVVGVLAGLAGCILPLLPGPPLSFLGFFVVWAARGFDARTFGGPTPWILLGATVLVTVVDVFIPVLGARRYGATKAGVWGSIAGMLAGMIWFPPFGMILGTFLGAFAGQFLFGGRVGKSMRAAWGVFVGTMLGIGLKLALSGVIAWIVVVEVLA